MAAVLLFVLFLLEVRAQVLPVCTSCPVDLRNGSEVALVCAEAAGAKMEGRCCVQKEGEIIGLDLWNCSISELDPELHLTSAALVIDLSQNPLRGLRQDFFQGLTSLQYIALPLNINCPGGNDAWESVESHQGSRICRNQHSACNTTGGVALLCPENSLCAPYGPGYTQCVCAAGFSGYKCLREGSFPTLMFFSILSSVTVSLAILLWCTQRKKVKDQ